jgi:alpha-tubulin suppressor-like RCC1 family protein
VVYSLPAGKLKQVAIGLTFNMFLMEDGTAIMSGELSQGGETFMNTWNTEPLLNLNEDLMFYEKIETKFELIRCGYSHALLLDTEGCVYSFGAGLNGQLGQGPEEELTRYPLPVRDINDTCDRVLLAACGANFTICYTELGILYSWGMLSPDNRASI